MSNSIKKLIIVLIVVVIAIISIFIVLDNQAEIKTVKSDKQLLKFYEGENYGISTLGLKILTIPFNSISNTYYRYDNWNNGKMMANDMAINVQTDSIITAENSSIATSDYSTTNIQVENVDEADIVKTDGEYIFSISDTNVIITNAKNPEEIKIEYVIESTDGSVPEDIILYKDKLIIISTRFIGTTYYSYYNDSNTVVSVYNIETKSKPILIKSYELNEPYYTSRCINNNLYVISSGNLRKENDKINRSYTENSIEKKIDLNKIKYLKNIRTQKQTLISYMNLDNATENIDVNSYLIDISNAYVSENSIYLLDEKHSYGDTKSIKDIFGIKGIFGIDSDYTYTSKYETEIYKFDIQENGKIEYSTKNKIEGKTVNQYSLDEKNGHLRIALFDNEGTRVAIFNEKLKTISISEYVAKGETMYSSRFMGDKVYLVTFKTMDPLFVVDISNETEPKILGQLKISGYSTYLHPYDENHIIGIGMETEEIYNRNTSGKIISTSSKITGMKMALFDVSNVNNPKQISKTVIGDSRTTSAILTNPKALLFSKEKNLLAIPVNNYAEDFEIDSTSDDYSTIISSYKNYNKKYTAEGYFVYNIDIENGFDLKGVIEHETTKKSKSNDYYYYYNNNSKLLRGLYINDNLYTVSETAIKVNKLDSLNLISELKIK